MTRTHGWWLPRLALLPLAALAMRAAAFGQTPVAPVDPIVDRIAAAAMQAQDLPGLAIAVAEHGRVVAVRAYGDADVTAHVPVRADTRFQIGSVTKQFTAACIMQLVDAHRLSLDDQLGTYVPAYAVARAVTIRQLLEHVSGIPDYLNAPNTLDTAGRTISFAALIASVARKQLAFAPGTRFAYSNTNYLLLGHIIELVAHEPYEQYVREHIFTPAGMTHSGFIGDGGAAEGTAHGYLRDASTLEPAPPLDETWAYAAGGIVSTVGDMLRWDDALLAGTIVPPADVDLMRTNARLADGTSTGFGLGWIADGTAAHPRIWHNGGTFGFSATNATYPADGTTIVALTNRGFASPVVIVAALFAALHPDAVPSVRPSAAGEDAAVTARVREWLQRFQTGDIDRAQLTDIMSAALTPDTVAAVRNNYAIFFNLSALSYVRTRTDSAHPGITSYEYAALLADGRTERVIIALDGAGTIAGFFALTPTPVPTTSTSPATAPLTTPTPIPTTPTTSPRPTTPPAPTTTPWSR